MSDAPRRLPQRTDADRVKTITRRMSGGSDDGQSANTRPVKPRPRRDNPRTPLGNGTVVTGDTSAALDADGVGLAIVSTEAGDPASTTKAALNSVALAPNAQANGEQALSLGYSAVGRDGGAIVAGWGAAGYGELIILLGASGVIGTTGTAAADGGGVGVGFAVKVYGVDSLALGKSAQVGTTGSPARNAAAVGSNSFAPNDDDFMLGNAANNVQVPGKLILSDDAGGRWELRVSTGGALSVVAYP